MINPARLRLRQSAFQAVRSILVFTGLLFAFFILYGRVSEHFGNKKHPDFLTSLEVTSFAGAVWFCLISIPRLYKTAVWAPAEEVLDEIPKTSQRSDAAFSAFVAMEYFCLILNRTFVVFVSKVGLHGWKVQGPVSNLHRNYFASYLDLLKDPALMSSPEAVEKLANLGGGFTIPRSDVESVAFDPTAKWGMGGIPHSGKINIKLSSGRSREFILLGSQEGERIRHQILGEP